jgi:hypothetical protein
VRNLILTAAGLILVSSAAHSFAGRYMATLAQPLAQKKEFIVNGNLFHCEGTSCVLTSTPLDAGSLQTCRAVQREVGALTAYGPEGKPFDAEKLAKCNAH